MSITFRYGIGQSMTKNIDLPLQQAKTKFKIDIQDGTDLNKFVRIKVNYNTKQGTYLTFLKDEVGSAETFEVVKDKSGKPVFLQFNQVSKLEENKEQQIMQRITESQLRNKPQWKFIQLGFLIDALSNRSVEQVDKEALRSLPREKIVVFDASKQPGRMNPVVEVFDKITRQPLSYEVSVWGKDKDNKTIPVKKTKYLYVNLVDTDTIPAGKFEQTQQESISKKNITESQLRAIIKQELLKTINESKNNE